MLGIIVFILAVVLGSVFLLAIVTAFASGTLPEWKTLRERYPEQVQAEFVERRTARVYLVPTDRLHEIEGRNRGCMSFFAFVFLFTFWRLNKRRVDVRIAVDDYYLHMDLDSGAVGPKAPVSIPWGTVTIGESMPTDIGMETLLTVDEFSILIPAASIERELLMRAAIDESMGDNPFDDPFDRPDA